MTVELPSDPSIRVQLPDRYRVERVIGRGGAAVVFAAHDTLLDRPVAVKVFVRPMDSAETLLAQEREAQVLGGLSHPGLVTVYDASADVADPAAPHAYLVMERVDGPDLAQWLRSHRADLTQIARMGKELCDALEHVHQHGILHRDIKPSNVLITLESGSVLHAKLSDFGVAVMVASPEPEGDFTVGTAAYLSPEQVAGDELTFASDIYSLGLVLLEAYTGGVAFPGTVVDSAFSRLDRDPVIAGAVPNALAAILQGMTARRPQDRLALLDACVAFQEILDDARSGGAPAAVAERQQQDAIDQFDDDDGQYLDPQVERIVRIAARVGDAPAAAILLRDRDRVVARAAHGLAEEEAARVADAFTPLVDGGHHLYPGSTGSGLQTAEPLAAAGIAALAAVPLPIRNSAVLGALCVFDSRPRTFEPALHDTLDDLAALAVHLVAVRRATRRALFAR